MGSFLYFFNQFQPCTYAFIDNVNEQNIFERPTHSQIKFAALKCPAILKPQMLNLHLSLYSNHKTEHWPPEVMLNILTCLTVASEDPNDMLPLYWELCNICDRRLPCKLAPRGQTKGREGISSQRRNVKRSFLLIFNSGYYTTECADS